MNRYQIALNKLPVNDISAVRDRKTGEILRVVDAERIIVLGDYNRTTTAALLKDALQISQLDNCRHIEFIGPTLELINDLKNVVAPQLADNSSFFCSDWVRFQNRGLKSTATALYLTQINEYLDMGSPLPIKDTLTWASGLTKNSRLVVSCNLTDFLQQMGYAIAPSKFVVNMYNKTAWTVKVLL